MPTAILPGTAHVENPDSRMKISHRLRYLLIDHAKNQSTVTYRELGASLKTEGDQLSELLDEVSDWCIEHQEPLLTSIAVRASGREKGLPGPGFWRKYGINVSGKAKRLETYRLQGEVFSFYKCFGQ